MRRTIFIFLVVVGILTLGIRYFVNEQLITERPQGQEIQFVEYGSFNWIGTAESPVAQLQSFIDRISEAAMQEQWTTASQTMQQLENAWHSLTPPGTSNLESEKAINQTLQTLHYNVWSQDQQAVLTTAQQLTVLINQFAS